MNKKQSKRKEKDQRNKDRSYSLNENSKEVTLV